jgi:hypothetical protein
MTRPLNAWSNKIQAMRQLAANWFLHTYALLWQKFYQARYYLINCNIRHKYIIFLAVIILVIAISGNSFHFLRNWLEKNGMVPNSFGDFRSLFLQLGSALIAATVIAFSLIMFAMQVNVERMPHGLFRKFSTDIRLIASFLGTFLLAIFIACASLIPDDISWVAAAILGSALGVILIFVLVWNAYRRALVLINPIEQLRLLINDTQRDLRIWVRRAKRAAPLFKEARSGLDEKPESALTTHDYSRLAYFQANPQWTTEAQRAINYAISFVRRYAEHGDHEVSGAALTAIISINREYVEAKGRTFFYNPPFFENPLSTDGFINNTLELLRQSISISIFRGDEQQIEQILRAMAALVVVYIAIDYSDKRASKDHAHLAASYLSEAVMAVVPHNMADVLMEGVRLVGQSAHIFLTTRSSSSLLTTLADKIGVIACTGIVNEKYRPVTLIAIDQLAKLTFTLIRADVHNVGFIVENLKKNVTMVAQLFLKVPTETFFESPLKSYFSVASPDGFIYWLTILVNAVLKAAPEDEASKKVIRNLETWADGLNRSQKELLLEAIEKRSQFTFDMIHWTSDVAKLLIAISNAPSCDDHSRDKLRKHAVWLMYIFSWIPDDKETASLVEAYQLTETLFEVAIEAYQRDCMDIYEELKKLLLGWAFKGGRYQTGWGILERSLYGLATLSMIESSLAFEGIKRQIADRLTQPNAPDREICDRTARDIRRRAATLYREGHWSSQIEHAMSQVEDNKMKLALEEFANILSPDTADEPINIFF